MKIANIKNKNGQWLTGLKVDGRMCVTASGEVWGNMNKRCLVGGPEQNKHPSYIGCTNDFVSFHDFTEWHIGQVGFGLTDYQLDKDILILGNKSYNEQACSLVPAALNKFLWSSKEFGSSLPQGVALEGLKFRVYITIDGKQRRLGNFNSPEEASCVYLEAKAKELKRWISRLENEEFLVDTNVIVALKKRLF